MANTRQHRQRKKMAPKEFQSIRETELALTQAELAEAMGVTRVTIGRWEAGMRAIPTMAVKLLEYLCLSKKVFPRTPA